MKEHTIVVRYPDGVEPRYSVTDEFKGGSVRAVDFDGNRLTVEEHLEEALENLITKCTREIVEAEDWEQVRFARMILEEARRVIR